MIHLYFSLIITLILILSRSLVIFVGGEFFSTSYFGGIFISYLSNFIFIYLLSWPLFPTPHDRPKKKKKKKKKEDEKPHQTAPLSAARLWGGLGLIGIYYFFMLSTFFYESVFTALPSKGVFFYFSQTKHLKSSIAANAPITSIILCMAIFIACCWILRKKLPLLISIQKEKKALIALAGAVLSLTTQSSSNVFDGHLYSGSRHGLLHLVTQVFDKTNDTKVIKSDVDFKKVEAYQRAIGQNPPRSGGDPLAPLCENRSYKTKVKNPRSVILLIVEGLGVEQLNKKVKGRYIAPHFRDVLSRNLTFNRFLASGSKSSNALPALFSGLPPQPHTNILWRIPPARMRGIPNILNLNNYATSYFHGSDLSFEHQREFLKKVGFKDIVELDPSSDKKIYGWGYDDATMYELLKNWIKKQSGPYFSSLFTLSTHDPYLLPSWWEPVFVNKLKRMGEGVDWFSIHSGDDSGKTMAGYEAYAFADTQFKKFYDWYNQNERPKGTLLIVVGDHTPYYLEPGSSEHHKFHVPLSIIGLSSNEIEQYRAFAGRRSAQHDFPSTLAHILGHDPHPCDQGLNLFAKESEWPKDRVIYSVAGESQERIYFWKNKGQGYFNKDQKKLTVVGTEQFQKLSKKEIRPFLMEIKGFIENMSPIQAYAINNNSFFPPDELEQKSKPKLNEVERPIFVSHRGNTQGPGTSQTENSLQALEKVVNSPFKWVELDIQITADGVPILNHDPKYIYGNYEHWIFRKTLSELRQVPQFKNVLTLESVLKKYAGKLNFLIEAKGQEHISSTLDLSRRIPDLVKKYAGTSKVIIDSFDTNLITSIKLYCNCTTAWDTPFQKPVTDEYLDFALEMNMDWIYVHHKVFSTDLMRRAHKKGLKVMVYTANDKNELSGSSILPDGVITDTKELLKEF